MFRPMRILLLPAMLLLLTGCAENAMHVDAAKRSENSDPDKAIEECRAVLKDKPTDVEANMVLGRVLQKMNKNSEAEEAYKNAIKGDSHNIDAHIQLGTLFLNRKDPDEAKQEFDAANIYDSKSVPALCGQGQVCEAKGDMAAAVAKYRDAVKADPDNIDAHKTLAAALGKMDKFDDAKVEIEQIRKLQANPPKPKS